MLNAKFVSLKGNELIMALSFNGYRFLFGERGPKMSSIIIMSFFIAVIVSIGIVFMNGKGAFLIVGYNILSKEEKKQYNTIALCKFMGKVMFALSFSMVFWILGDIFNAHWIYIVGAILFSAIVIFTIIYANTGNRFKK